VAASVKPFSGSVNVGLLHFIGESLVRVKKGIRRPPVLSLRFDMSLNAVPSSQQAIRGLHRDEVPIGETVFCEIAQVLVVATYFEGATSERLGEPREAQGDIVLGKLFPELRLPAGEGGWRSGSSEALARQERRCDNGGQRNHKSQYVDQLRHVHCNPQGDRALRVGTSGKV
jgi:hypothetical protein